MGKGENKRQRALKKVQALTLRREKLVQAEEVEVQLSTLTVGTTDDATANKFIEYELDVYFATSTSELSVGGVDYPARQLNIDLLQLPGVERNDASENKRPLLVSGKLLARPKFDVATGVNGFASNPNIFSGRLVTPLGVDLGGLGATADVSLYDNGIKNLEPDVRQNYVMVNSFNYLSEMPMNAPASKRDGGSEYTNLFCLGLVTPDGTKWENGLIAFRFVLVYRVPVVLKSTVGFAVQRNSNDSDAIVDGILAASRNIKDVILPIVGDTASLANVERTVFPDAVKVMKQN